MQQHINNKKMKMMTTMVSCKKMKAEVVVIRLCSQVVVLIVLICIMIMSGGMATPPADPVQCSSSSSQNTNCTVTNSIGAFPDRSVCVAGGVVYPATEEDLVAIVATATKSNRKMKVTTRYSHSIPKLVCPDGEEGLLISTNSLNRTVNVDSSAGTITVESGVTLREIIAQSAAANMSLPYTPYWWGLTIGGLMGTGAHGSTLQGNGSAVHDYVLQLRIVTPASPQDGYAKLRILGPSDADLNAAKLSLGVLGVISQVTLKLEPLFKRSITYERKDDSDLGDELISFGRQHEFGDVIWYPSQRQAVYRIDDRVPITTPGDGSYNFIPFRSTLSAILAAARVSEEFDEATHNPTLKCTSAEITISTLKHLGYGLANNGLGIFLGYPVVGYSNRLQSSGTCLDSKNDLMATACAWDPRVKGEFYHQTAFSIPLSSVKSFIQDVQKLVQLEPLSLCGLELYNGILMRYVTASSAYLGKEEDAVDFDITYYRSKDSSKARLFEDVIEEIEQMGLFKYGGLPHWGKNRNVGFVGAVKKYRNWDKFMKVKEAYDPQGLFSSEWTDQVLGVKQGLAVGSDGCALEGLCICSQDSHCAPSQGYYCKPGRVYAQARVFCCE